MRFVSTTLFCAFAAFTCSGLAVGSEAAPGKESVDYEVYDRLLESYVVETGVRYAAWHASEADLDALEGTLEAWSEVEVDRLSRAEQKAFYINLYNAGMLRAVLREYPIDSVTEIGFLPFSVFKKNLIRQGDRELSLDEIEKGILLEQYFDPRIHFAVNCASESCPPLRSEAFRGALLDAQLDEQTRAFAQSDHAARVNPAEKSISFSELFNWYADDFPGTHPSTYLNRYRDQPLPTDYSIDWIEYDWSLNEAREE